MIHIENLRFGYPGAGARLIDAGAGISTVSSVAVWSDGSARVWLLTNDRYFIVGREDGGWTDSELMDVRVQVIRALMKRIAADG